jgi:hypothetical protein
VAENHSRPSLAADRGQEFLEQMAINDFSWLHITDLHVGMQNHSWLWPELKHLFFDDLERQAERVAKLKVVIFY